MAKVFITGDVHSDVTRFNMKNFPIQKELTKEDVVIICGDFGLIWDYKGQSENEKYWLNWLNEKPFTTIFIDGNHENFDRLYAYPECVWNGAKAHQIMSSIYHIQRGEIFTLNGKTFFCFGGASSHDIQDGIIPYSENWKEKAKKLEYLDKYMYRVEKISWWEQELPNEEEMQYGLEQINQYEKVDYIITHEMPSSALMLYGKGFYQPDKFSKYLNQFIPKVNKHWYCGHYHEDKKITNSITCLYANIQQIA